MRLLHYDFSTSLTPETSLPTALDPTPDCKTALVDCSEAHEEGNEVTTCQSATLRGVNEPDSFTPLLMPNLDVRRDVVCRTLSKTLAPINSHYKSQVLKLYRHLTDKVAPLNPKRRFWLAEAIFKVENDLEHRQPKHPQVAAMRMVRNRLYDDLGWNEYAKTKSTNSTKGIPHAN